MVRMHVMLNSQQYTTSILEKSIVLVWTVWINIEYEPYYLGVLYRIWEPLFIVVTLPVQSSTKFISVEQQVLA